MKRIKYFVSRKQAQVRVTSNSDDQMVGLDVIDDGIVMSQVLPEDEVFDPPPWVRHGIEHQGWEVIRRDLGESPLNDHGHVDWKDVAIRLAGAVEGLQQQEDLQDPEPAESASMALDHFRIALTEEAMRETAEEPDHQVPGEDDEEDDD